MDRAGLPFVLFENNTIYSGWRTYTLKQVPFHGPCPHGLHIRQANLTDARAVRETRTVEMKIGWYSKQQGK